MSDSTAFYDSFDAVELELPTGETVRCKPLNLAESARFLRLLDKARTGDGNAMLEVMEEFPKAVEARGLAELHPVEFFGVIDRFFTTAPTRRKQQTRPMHATG